MTGESYELAPESAPFDPATWTPLPLRTAPARPDAVAELLAWAARAGAWFDPIEIVVAPTGNRTTHARHAVAAGELLVSVPRRLLITELDVLGNRVVAAASQIGRATGAPPGPVGLWLALEQANPASPWRPYLDALPPSYPWMPMHRPAAELVGLRGTRALAMIAYLAAGHRADRHLLAGRLAEVAALPLADYVWGQTASASRIFGVATARGAVTALIPVVDMLDHGRVDATWAYVDAEAQLELRAAHDLEAGQEIQISYGHSRNAARLLAYGMVAADDPDGELLVPLSTPAGDVRVLLASRHDSRFGFARTVAAMTDGVDEAGALARIAAAARAAADEIAAAPPPAGDRAWQAVCERVRTGERAIAAAVIEFVDEVTGGGLDRPAAAWHAIVARIKPAATGAARLLRDYAQAALVRYSDGPPS